MATTIDYDSATIKRLWRRLSGGQTTMGKNLTEPNDYDSLTKLCPLMMACAWASLAHDIGAEEALSLVRCNGPCCAWWDADKERCAVLSLARNK